MRTAIVYLVNVVYAVALTGVRRVRSMGAQRLVAMAK